MNPYKTLCRIAREQCEVQSDGTIELEAPKQISSDSLQKPSDPDATFSGQKGRGIKCRSWKPLGEKWAYRNALI
jgi:hypothetical protein